MDAAVLMDKAAAFEVRFIKQYLDDHKTEYKDIFSNRYYDALDGAANKFV